MTQTWLPVPDPLFSALYRVSDAGNVCRVPAPGAPAFARAGPLAPYRNPKSGHLMVRLSVSGLARAFYIHRLVLLAFRPRPAAGLVTRHLNGDPTDNRLANLAWGTRAENFADAVAHGATPRGRSLTQAQVADIRAALAAGTRQPALALRFGVSQATISNIARGRTWAPLPGEGDPLA